MLMRYTPECKGRDLSVCFYGRRPESWRGNLKIASHLCPAAEQKAFWRLNALIQDFLLKCHYWENPQSWSSRDAQIPESGQSSFRSWCFFSFDPFFMAAGINVCFWRSNDHNRRGKNVFFCPLHVFRLTKAPLRSLSWSKTELFWHTDLEFHL